MPTLIFSQLLLLDEDDALNEIFRGRFIAIATQRFSENAIFHDFFFRQNFIRKLRAQPNNSCSFRH
jgi:hypothetical protein